MFVEERQTAILDELNEKGRVRVKDLSQRFQVTEDLIRKDLHALEKAGKLKRKYGGAVSMDETVQRRIVAQKKNEDSVSRKIIAQQAFDLIETGMIVFLDISTTNIYLAKLIAQSSLTITVVTNMLEIVQLLVNTNVNVICIGGELDYGRDGFIGTLALEMLQKFRFDMAFMGAVGLSLEDNSVEIYMANEGLSKSAAIKASKVSCLLIENQKLERLGNYKYARVDEFDCVILNQPLDEKTCKAFASLDVKVLDNTSRPEKS